MLKRTSGMDESAQKTVRILIVDDDRRIAKTLSDILKVKGYDTQITHDGTLALDIIDQEVFDCVISDIKMPTINGIDLCRMIKEKHPSLPVILMTSYASEEIVKQGIKEGALGVVPKPLDVNQLLSVFTSLKKSSTIAIIDDDPDFCLTLKDILVTRGYDVKAVTKTSQLDMNRFEKSDVILMDLKLRDSNAIEIMQSFRKRFPNKPVVLITGYREEMTASINTAMDLGAYTYLYKPLQIDRLIEQLNEIKNTELKKLLSVLST